MAAKSTTTAAPKAEARNQHSGRTGRARTADQPKAKAPSTPKGKVEPKLTTTPLSEIEANMVATLTVDPKVDPAKITKAMLVKRFPKMVKLVDEGRLRFYTAARYGSAHDNEWISPALVARIRKAVVKDRPGTAD